MDKSKAQITAWFSSAHDDPTNLQDAIDERDEMLVDWILLTKALGYTEYQDVDVILQRAAELVKVNNMYRATHVDGNTGLTEDIDRAAGQLYALTGQMPTKLIEAGSRMIRIAKELEDLRAEHTARRPTTTGG